MYKIYSLIVSCFFLAGCTVSEYVVSDNSAANQRPPPSRYRDDPGALDLPNIWVGKNVSELVEGLGKPDMMIDTRPRGGGLYDGVCNYAYVYLPKPDTADQCFRTYMIDDLSEEVTKFHCR
jgi:hypothetical protein